MTVAAANLLAGTGPLYRKAITAGVIGNVLEWYDFGVYGYLVPTISQLFFPKATRSCRYCRPLPCSASVL